MICEGLMIHVYFHWIIFFIGIFRNLISTRLTKCIYNKQTSIWLFYFIIFGFFFSRFYLFIYFLLYNIVLVLPYLNMNPPRVYTCSQSWISLPPPSPYHFSGSSQCTSPKHPVSCSEPRLAIHFLYDIIHVSMSFSQIIPPSPSPTESKRLFYTSVSLLLSRIQSYCYHLSIYPTTLLYSLNTSSNFLVESLGFSM